MYIYFIVILSCLVLVGCTEKVKENFLAEVKFDQNEVTIKNFENDKESKVSNYLFNLSNEKEKLKINKKTLKLSDAKRIVEQKTNEIKMLFAPQQVPYFGQISKDITCTNGVNVDLKPIENDLELSQQMNLAATEYLIYGTCMADQEIYKSQFLLLYCKKSETLYEFKYYYDRTSPFRKKIASCE